MLSGKMSFPSVEFRILNPRCRVTLALPYADTDMMQLHLEEISRNVAAGAHAVLLLDRAGWHTTGKLDMPANITPIFLPSRAPELNPVENVWQYLRQNWLSNTVFENYHAIVDAACDAWRKLIAQPETITSIGMREWAHVDQPLICSPKIGPFGVRVFRGIFPRLGGAEDDEGLEVLGRAEGVHSEAGQRRRTGCRDLPEGRDQPGDLFQLEEEVRRHAAA